MAFHGTANIPVVIDWAELAWQAVKAFVMVVVASIIPALITARQDPARSCAACNRKPPMDIYWIQDHERRAPCRRWR